LEKPSTKWRPKFVNEFAKPKNYRMFLTLPGPLAQPNSSLTATIPATWISGGLACRPGSLGNDPFSSFRHRRSFCPIRHWHWHWPRLRFPKLYPLGVVRRNFVPHLRIEIGKQWVLQKSLPHRSTVGSHSGLCLVSHSIGKYPRIPFSRLLDSRADFFLMVTDSQGKRRGICHPLPRWASHWRRSP
jgi:hypothetical protein